MFHYKIDIEFSPNIYYFHGPVPPKKKEKTITKKPNKLEEDFN